MCGEEGQFAIQFKHGHCRLHEYALGDLVRWGKDHADGPTKGEVVVPGVALACPHLACRAPLIDFEVTIVDGVITSARALRSNDWPPLPPGATTSLEE